MIRSIMLHDNIDGFQEYETIVKKSHEVNE